MNELATIKPANADVQAYRASTEAADLCKEIVVASSSEIQGRRFVSVEGWQAIAIAHGCAAGSRDVERVEGGVRAIGEIRRMSDGQLIATAEGFVGEDEPTWFGGEALVWDKHTRSKIKKILPKRPDYAIRAMAQTRAISRAGRSAFAHVVVMMKAGLATTPAEEVPHGGFDAETGEVVEASAKRLEVPGITKIRERLNKMKTEGDAATDLNAFNALIKTNKDDLKAIRDADHPLWTGDGEDFEGFAAWKDRRKVELSPPQMGEIGQMCMDTLAQCTSKQELDGWFKLNWKYVEELDGAERDTVEARYQELEQGFKQLAEVTDGG
jgi:hypothetical protein